jgi:serine O-acetyltransferase
MFENIRADIAHKRRWYYKDDGWLKQTLGVLIQPGTIAVIVYRYGHWAYRIRYPALRFLCMLPYWVINFGVVSFTQILIWPSAEIGKGFVVHMFSGILIADAIIGENCIVYQGVNVGHLRHFRGIGRRKGRRPPRVGNNVYLGAGCKILGDVVIGDNVVVGANSLVITSVPDNCTVLGVPARIVSRNNRWIREKATLAANSERPSAAG